MERMQKDLRDGEEYIFANTPEEYESFADWLCANGGTFAYHFEAGEGYQYKGKTIEIYGL
ncbi:MAG: hypothetical protein EBT13_15105 [Rhodobacteraceae bacterium]|nr:hypothetical protein [Paracoccaceae bacterium]